MAKNTLSAPFSLLIILFVTCLLSTQVESGFHKWMADMMGWGGGGGGGGWDNGWESKGVTFGLKSKGMTAIIPIPLPIPIFSKDKKGGDDSNGGGNGGSNGGSNGGGGGSTKGDSNAGGWEAAAGSSDWWK